MHIHVLVGYLNSGSTIDLKKIAVHWAAMTTPPIQYNTMSDCINVKNDASVGLQSGRWFSFFP
jgi:hypothetical protein